MAEPQHHLYSASGSDGTLACPGKAAMEYGIPDTFSPYADEGSAAHFVASVCLIDQTNAKDYLDEEIICWEKEGERDGQCWKAYDIPKGGKVRSRWTVTDEMAEHVESYTKIVRDKLKEGRCLLWVEQRLPIGDMTGVDGQFGTADCVIVYLEPGTKKVTGLYVGDLKYGRKPVSSSTPQAKLYALGAMAQLKKEDYDLSELKTVWVQIIQPRIHNYPEQMYTVSQLLEFAEEYKNAVDASEEAFDTLDVPNMWYDTKEEWAKSYLRYSEKGCTWCKAKGQCPEFASQAVETVYHALPVGEADLDDLPDLDNPLALPQETFESSLKRAIGNVPSLDLDTVAKLYKASALFDEFRDAIASRLHSELMNGAEHPDWKLVRGRAGNRKWSDPDQAEEVLKSMRLKTDEMYDRKLIGPTKAEKVLKESPRKWKKVEELIVREEGKVTIAPTTDKREAYVPPTLANMDDIPELPEEDFGDLII